MKLLLLGGTADARYLAESLYQNNIELIYSIAGLVRLPKLPCQIVSGGFTQFGGLENFISSENITAIIDVTHPYAQTMSSKAAKVSKLCKIPYWRFHRREWQQQAGDNWQFFDNWKNALPVLAEKKSVLLTAGQLEQSFVEALSQNKQQRQFLRTAVAPKIDLPKTMTWIKAIGPFSYEDEFDLMRKNNIDVLISKNSGGDSTIAKLHAARELALPVLMLKRPQLPDADQLFFTRDEFVDFITKAALSSPAN